MSDQIGCDKTGKCIAKSKADCWRFSTGEMFSKICEYKEFGDCKNCHALDEALEGEGGK